MPRGGWLKGASYKTLSLVAFCREEAAGSDSLAVPGPEAASFRAPGSPG